MLQGIIARECNLAYQRVLLQPYDSIIANVYTHTHTQQLLFKLAMQLYASDVVIWATITRIDARLTSSWKNKMKNVIETRWLS